MHYQFEHYNAGELDVCGTRFVADAKSFEGSKIQTAEFTEFVLDWFASARRSSAAVDARKRRPNADWRRHARTLASIGRRDTPHGEFLVDLCHSSYPPATSGAGYRSEQYYDQAHQGGPCEILLALESEWGKKGTRAASMDAVLQDAVKVAHVAAKVKVVIYASENGNRTLFIDKLSWLRETAGDTKTPWLLVDVPWNIGDAAWQPHSKVLRVASAM